MQLHDNFEWHENKAKKNLKKHSVSFEEAAHVLADEEGDIYHVEEFDDDHSDEEDRYVTTGSHPDDRSIVLRVSWTEVSTKQAKITRIISCRVATTAERTRYAKEIGGN
jgi:uncharacterized protein